MSKVRISNCDARRYVENRIEFDANNIFARWTHDERAYVVYSYGFHWPMYVFEDGQWYANSDKRSVTTSKHANQTRPTGAVIIEFDHSMIESIISDGIAMAVHMRNEPRIPVIV